MPDQKPTVGRVVHFLPPFTGSDQPRAGLVIAVNQLTQRPDIVYWDISGEQHIARDVEHSDTLQPDRWCWPPRAA